MYFRSETDDDALKYPDMSNLAVKGIIAISAMAKLAKALEKPNAEINLYKVDGPTFLQNNETSS